MSSGLESMLSGLESMPSCLESGKDIEKSGTEHISHGVDQNKGKEIFGSSMIKVVVNKTENDTDNQRGRKPLIGVEGNTDQCGIEKSLPLVFLVYRTQETEEEVFLIKGIQQCIEDGERA